jgi:hypothetical protein
VRGNKNREKGLQTSKASLLWGKRLKLLLFWERSVIAWEGIWVFDIPNAQQPPTNNTTDLEGA